MEEFTTIRITKADKKALDDFAWERRIERSDLAFNALLGELTKPASHIETSSNTNPTDPGQEKLRRVVQFKGDKAYINMPRTWKYEEVDVIKVKK
jgi:hypothetical protein